MERNHIHFAKGFNHTNTTKVISGYRDNCSVVIVIDLAQALKGSAKLI
jgi:RNA:NAD 2'-phosphotransferase (TPT1/KptA family)